MKIFAKTDELTRHPIIIPKNHPIVTLLVRHFHTIISYQARHMTEGVICSSGYWIIGSRHLVYSLIWKCVPHRKLHVNNVGSKWQTYLKTGWNQIHPSLANKLQAYMRKPYQSQAMSCVVYLSSVKGCTHRGNQRTFNRVFHQSSSPFPCYQRTCKTISVW